jgi:hypothetical protein
MQNANSGFLARSAPRAKTTAGNAKCNEQQTAQANNIRLDPDLPFMITSPKK